MSRWVWAGARAVGTSHLAQALPCQDAFACRVWQRAGVPPVLVAVLADGAGSAERADVGALLAATLVRDIVCEALDEGIHFDDVPELLRHAVTETRLALALKATHDGREINDYASTLLAVIAHPSGAVAGQIGDGAIVVDNGTDGWRAVHWPDHGEYANTTSFLTQEDALDNLRLEVIAGPVRRLSLFSDGLERLLLDFRAKAAHGPFFDRLLAPLEAAPLAGCDAALSRDIKALLNSDKVNDRTDDDKSLVCATFIEE